MRGEKVRLDELAGRLAASAEKHWHVEVEDDRKCIPEHSVRMGLATVVSEQDIRNARLDHHARCPVSG